MKKEKYVILLYEDNDNSDPSYSNNCVLLKFHKIDNKKHQIWGEVISCKLNKVNIFNSYDKKLPFGRWKDYIMFDDLETASKRFLVEIL